MDSELQKLKEQISEISARNARVESEKAWEISWFRVLLITGTTYVFACLFLFMLGVENFLLNALVPALGYFLSTQSVPTIKHWWIKNRYKSFKKNPETSI